MTGPSVRGWLRQRHNHRAKIRAARRQADRERKAAEKRVEAARWRDFSRGGEQDQGGSQQR